MRPHPNPKGEKEVAVKVVVAVARAIILSSNTEILEILEIPGMDLILEILAMDQTTITTKIMAQMEITTITTERKRRE